MKQLSLLLLLLLLTACNPKKFYTLGEDLIHTSEVTYTAPLDVMKVTVPKYLKEHKIVRQITPYQVELIDKAHWLIPMEKKLTHMLINYLQHTMNNPNVHLYPWHGDNNITKRISIDIKRFIASETEVHLKANYKITHLSNNKSQIKLFQTKVKTTKNTEEMMISMEKAYLELLEDIGTTLINNK